MPFDSRLSRPQEYMDDVAKLFNRDQFTKSKYDQQFRAGSTTAPFQINRFDSRDLRNKLVTRKPITNPRLSFVNDDIPDNFNLFEGLPDRFDTNRKSLYDFETGRPVFQKATFLDSVEFQLKGQKWKETFELSPTVEPDKRPKNPMPRSDNPDPQNYIFKTMESKAESEAQGKMNVAQLLKASPEEIKEAEDKGPVK